MASHTSNAETARQERAQGGISKQDDSGDPTLAGGDQAHPQSGKKTKMAPQSSAPPGLEQDNRGLAIPLEKRTEDDQQLARSGQS